MDSSDSILRQAAALTYRIGEDALELLLVTSRETHRWIVPKGNIEPGMSAADSARQETFEEAGVMCGTARDSRSTLREFGGGTNAVMCSAFWRGLMTASPDGFREWHPNKTSASMCR